MGVVNVTPDSFSDGGRYADDRGRGRPRPRPPGRRAPTSSTSAASPRAPARRGRWWPRSSTGSCRSSASWPPRAPSCRSTPCAPRSPRPRSRPAPGSSTTSPAAWPTPGSSTSSPTPARRTSRCTGARHSDRMADLAVRRPGGVVGDRTRRARRPARRVRGGRHRAATGWCSTPAWASPRGPPTTGSCSRGLDVLAAPGLPAAGRREPQVLPGRAAGRRRRAAAPGRRSGSTPTSRWSRCWPSGVWASCGCTTSARPRRPARRGRDVDPTAGGRVLAVLAHGRMAAVSADRTTDELAVTGIECFAHHGVFDFERREGQTFVDRPRPRPRHPRRGCLRRLARTPSTTAVSWPRCQGRRGDATRST